MDWSISWMPCVVQLSLLSPFLFALTRAFPKSNHRTTGSYCTLMEAGLFFWESSFSWVLCGKLALLVQSRVELRCKLRCGGRKAVWELRTRRLSMASFSLPQKPSWRCLFPQRLVCSVKQHWRMISDFWLLTSDLGAVRRTSLNVECPATFFSIFIGLEGKTKESQGMSWLERKEGISSEWGSGTSS